MPLLAHKLDRIKPSATVQINNKVLNLIAKGRRIIKLNIGEPDFDTPEHVKEAAITAIRAGETKYTQVDGTPKLKAAIIDKFKRENDLHYDPAQIIVSTGAKQSLYNLFLSVLNPGDEVIIPAPYWTSYPDMVKLCDGTPIIAETQSADHHKLSADVLRAHITDKTKLLILNSPSNPTGRAYSREALVELGEVLRQHPNILVVSDDIYEHIYWANEPFCNIAMACPELYKRIIIVNGPSKVYAMTGWRIGYAAGDEAIIKAMTKCQSQSTSNPCSISQAATAAAMMGDQAMVTERCAAFKARHDHVLSLINDIPGFSCLPTEGTFYAFANVEEAIAALPSVNNDTELATFLLDRAGVACMPGSAFGAPGFLRFSYALGMDEIKTAMADIKAAVS